MVVQSGDQPPVGSPASNEIVRANLRALGDDGLSPRKIRHLGRPGPEEAAPAEEVVEDFGLSLSTFGFRAEVEEIEGETWVILAHVAPVTAEALDRWTAWLDRTLAEMGWIYDGWDCDVQGAAAAEATADKEPMT